MTWVIVRIALLVWVAFASVYTFHGLSRKPHKNVLEDKIIIDPQTFQIYRYLYERNNRKTDL